MKTYNITIYDDKTGDIQSKMQFFDFNMAKKAIGNKVPQNKYISDILESVQWS